MHLKRETNSCFINNYNPVRLKAWQASIDLQPVYNYYLSARVAMKKLAYSFICSRQMSVQEAVYLFLTRNMAKKMSTKCYVFEH